MAVIFQTAVAEIADAYLVAVARADAEALLKLKEAIRQVIAGLEALRDNATKLASQKPNERVAAIGAIEKHIKIEDAPQLKTFFHQVGNAVRAAQQELDKAAAKDLQESPPELRPVLYSIPSVRAELKLGFSQVTQSGVNFVIIQSSEQRQRYAESTISFEIAASPLPPKEDRFAPPPPGKPPVPEVREEEVAPPPPPVGELAPALTMPLTGAAKAEALERLRALAGARARRREILALEPDDICVIPSMPEREAATLMYLAIARARAAIRVHVAAVSGLGERAAIVARALVPPSRTTPSLPRGQVGLTLSTVPPRGPGVVDSIEAAAAALVHLYTAAQHHRPGFCDFPDGNVRIANAINDRLGRRPGAAAPWVAFRLAPEEFVVIEPFMRPGTDEWQALLVTRLLLGSRRKPVAVRVPPRAEIVAAAQKAPAVTSRLARDLVDILAKLVALINNAGR